MYELLSSQQITTGDVQNKDKKLFRKIDEEDKVAGKFSIDKKWWYHKIAWRNSKGGKESWFFWTGKENNPSHW